jgi:hypothetical protein
MRKDRRARFWQIKSTRAVANHRPCQRMHPLPIKIFYILENSPQEVSLTQQSSRTLAVLGIDETMPIIKPAAVDPKAPQQHKQPSRKGKKAWRKNIDVTEIQEGLEVVRDEVIAGYGIAHFYFKLLLIKIQAVLLLRKSHRSSSRSTPPVVWEFRENFSRAPSLSEPTRL